MTVMVGIDPGITGAIAVLNNRLCVEVHDMPVMAKASGKGRQVNPYALHSMLINIHEEHIINLAMVERVSAMPGQGVTSMFSFGKSAGIVEGVLAAIGCKVMMPTPQAWKKRAGLTGKDKDASRTLAIQQFPEVAERLSRKKDNGRADAILIAEYGAHMEGNQ